MGDGLPRRILLRSSHGGAESIAVTRDDESKWRSAKPVKLISASSPPASAIKVAANGAVAVVSSSKTESIVRVIRESTENSVKGAFAMVHLSPNGSFVTTYERKPADGKGNIAVWCVATGEEKLRLHEKSSKSWPSIQWTADEAFAAHMVNNEVRVYSTSDFKICRRARCKGVRIFGLAPDGTQIATFKGESKGRPSQLSMYAHPGSEDTPTCSKSMFKAQDVTMQWAPSSTGVLCKTETSVGSGDSYYGESGLYLLTRKGEGCAIETGSVYAFDWIPDGRSFIAISGKMPSKAALYNLKGASTFSFGEKHRNTVRVSPNGKFACIGGFGNLAGELDFWDLERKTLLATVDASCTVDFGWSPCSRLFLTASTAPRMRVDNGIVVWSYSGEVVDRFDYSSSELFEAKWLPADEKSYEEDAARGASPRVAARKKPLRGGTGGGGGTAKAKPAKKQTKAYRPPGARSGAATGGRSLSALLKTGGASSSRQRGIPGMKPVVGGVPKKKKKPKKKKAPKPDPQVSVPEPAPAQPPAPQAAVDPKKRMRALKKKLRQIDELKKKVEAGAQLSDAQKTKLNTESDILKEIEKLEL